MPTTTQHQSAICATPTFTPQGQDKSLDERTLNTSHRNGGQDLKPHFACLCFQEEPRQSCQEASPRMLLRSRADHSSAQVFELFTIPQDASCARKTYSEASSFNRTALSSRKSEVNQKTIHTPMSPEGYVVSSLSVGFRRSVRLIPAELSPLICEVSHFSRKLGRSGHWFV